VPLNEESLFADLMQAIELPAVVVAHSGLGTINHTLLTIEALRRRAIPVLAVVLNGPENRANEEAIAFYGEVATLALSPLSPLDRSTVRRAASAFDREALLERWLRPEHPDREASPGGSG
jgi:dethiobiotin synthetase